MASAEGRAEGAGTSLTICRNPMRALSIRQPYAEEILRGIKTIEYRSRRTRKVDERFYIYAARQIANGRGISARFRRLGSKPGGLPTGLLVGTAKISDCVR